MASGIFALLDDVAALMDDVAVASKVAAQKTAGILGDDLAVNADKATGFVSSRELPVLWAITKGSFLNKLIIVPIALLLNIFLPSAIKIILILGGLYLAYEGVEKIVEFIFHKNKPAESQALTDEKPVSEKQKIRSAITTDFILSVEIVIIALGSVLQSPLPVQIITVAVVSVLATVGVYGIVALIVRMDDLGFRIIKKSNGKGAGNVIGKFLVAALPIIIRLLSFVGTIALILVAGGIFAHNIPALHHVLENLPGFIREMIFGVIGGLLGLGLIFGIQKLKFNLIKK